MWSYIVKRLLLVIPTLFGVTIVTFLVMQLAPGDPLLTHLNAGGSAGKSTTTREAFLLQKRDLKLDKPILLNFRTFGDYRERIAVAAYYESIAIPDPLAVQTRVAEDLALLAEGAAWREDAPTLFPPTPLARMRFLRALDIPEFETQLADPEMRPRLASAVVAYVNNYCEDLGATGVPAAMELLNSDAATLPSEWLTPAKVGAIRCLARMVPDPFVATYKRTPSEAESPLVALSWQLWWKREKSNFAPLDAAQRQVVEELLRSLAAEPSRERVFEQLEEFEKSDSPLLVETLESAAPLSQKALAALVLKLYNGPPLKTDVAPSAATDEVERVAANWQAMYAARRSEYDPSFAAKTWRIATDTQYAHMVRRLVTFDFGRSAVKTHEPVSQLIWRAVAVSAPLMLIAEFVIYFVAVPLGILCAVKRGRLTDRLVSLGLFFLYSVPPFVAGMMFLLLLCYGDYLKWFPVSRLHSDAAFRYGFFRYWLDYLHHAVLPVLCLSLFSLASLAMYSRSAMLDVISQDYIRTARAKGLSGTKVVLKHALRNGLIPIITLFSNSLPALLGGSVLVEYLFNLPGMGGLGYESINLKDFPTVMALVYIEAIVVLASILLSDLLYVLVDPRIGFESQGGAG